MENCYPLEWIEDLIQTNLNIPAKPLNALPRTDLEETLKRLHHEHWHVVRLISKQILLMAKRGRIEVLLREQYNATVELMNRAFEISEVQGESLPEDRKLLYLEIMQFFDRLLNMLEGRFREYLSKDRCIPFIFLHGMVKGIIPEMHIQLTRLEHIGYDKELLLILARALSEKLSPEEGPLQLTYNEFAHIQLIITGFSELGPNLIGEISPLDELLISLNFNNRNYIQHFINQQGSLLAQYGSYTEMGKYLYRLQNRCKRIVMYPSFCFDPAFSSVTDLLAVWSGSEIVYCETMTAADVEPQSQTAHKHLLDHIKVVLNLTTDQISILVRGAYELKYLIANSVSAAFRSIIPFVSSRDKANISWNSTRTKSYDPERRDIDIVIDFLYKLIDKIREY